MVSKSSDRISAIKLRKEGKTYKEILSVVNVAKSTLSLWLRSVELTKRQKQVLTAKKRSSALRGGLTRKNARLRVEKDQARVGKNEIGRITERDLFIAGVALYWAEGSKIKSYSPSVQMIFSNSDPCMVKTYINWCRKCLNLTNKDLSFSIYVHQSERCRINLIKAYWSTITELDSSKFDKIYYKRHNPNPKRKKIGDQYFGQLRIQIKRSTNINRKVTGYIEGLSSQCGVV